MPVDKNIVDSMLNPFRAMVQEVEQKNLSGAAVDTMKEMLAKMEAYALETDDIASYSTRLATEGLFMNFSNAYGQALSAAAQQEYSGSDGDEKLLQQSLEAYKNALVQIEGKPFMEPAVDAVRNIISLAESGISYPRFLLETETQGLNELLQGAVIIRDVLETELEFSRLMHSPLHISRAEELIALFDGLAEASPRHRPDTFEYELKRREIEWKYEPQIIRWNMVINHWDRLLSMILDWHDAFCSFAPYDQRWADLRGMEYTLRNIRRTKECTPGMLKVREKIFEEYFGLRWDDIFSHETFLNELQAAKIVYSDTALSLMRSVYPLCVPGGRPSDEHIAAAEKQHGDKSWRRPDAFKMSDEDRERFIRVFGKEKFEEMYGK